MESIRRQGHFLRNSGVPKKFKVNITEHAQDDLEKIYYFIAEDNINNAKRFIHQIEVKIFTLETFPERQPLISENEYFNTDYRHLIYKKYRIIYKIVSDEVYILRVIHGAKLLDI